MTDLAESEQVCTGLARLPEDADSLLTWLCQALTVLSGRVKSRSEGASLPFEPSPLCAALEARCEDRTARRQSRPKKSEAAGPPPPAKAAAPRTTRSPPKGSKRRR